MGRTILIVYVHKVIDVYEVSQSNVLCTLNLLQVCLICQKGTLLWQGSMLNLKQGKGLKDAQNAARLDGSAAVLTQKHTSTLFCLKYSSRVFPSPSSLCCCLRADDLVGMCWYYYGMLGGDQPTKGHDEKDYLKPHLARNNATRALDQIRADRGGGP